MNGLDDESYMRLALQMAAGAQGQTAVNPVVGCVIVKNGRIIGLGSHLETGTAHAEIHALQMAGKEALNSTVYVTLEPCSHTGRTPPCADRLIAEGVKKVFVACMDPNPKVAGSGIEKLRQQGIEVHVGLLEQEAIQLNEKFNKYIAAHVPYVTLKTASTLDGKIASFSGDSKWITNSASRKFVHTLRHQHQAIMVGVETIINDDPKLTTRLPVPALNPLRIIVDSNLRTPMNAQVIQDVLVENQHTLILTTDGASKQRQEQYEELGVEVVRCGSEQRVNLRHAMKLLADREIGSILLEGGGRLNGSMLEAELIDKIMLFIAPKIIGGGNQAPDNFNFSGFSQMKDAIGLNNISFQQFEDDICIIGTPQYGGGS